MNFSRLLVSIAFIALMVWLWAPHFMQEQSEQAKPKSNEIIPDYVATKLSQKVYNHDGELDHQVKAQKVETYQELGFSHFEKPQFTFYLEQDTWQVLAQEATLYDNQKLVLENQVKAINLNELAMVREISAEVIEIDLNKDSMSSSQPVEIIGPSIHIKGQGLHADLKREIIELNNHTHTVIYNE